jgi:CDP-glucose 4,6-dehydratase
MEKLANFAELADKRILVTGDTGFKGTWLMSWLTLLGARVTGISLPARPTDRHYQWVESKFGFKHRDLDIRDAEAVRDVFEAVKPEVVFHLAAQALVRTSYDDPADTISTNVLGSLNILEAVRRTPSVRSLVYVTSDKCYKNKEWVWGYRETDELGGNDPYSASKACAEIVFQSYRASFLDQIQHLGCASVRAGNVIGGGDYSADRIVPDCIRSLEEQTALKLRHPEATRPWQHVLEPLSGYLNVACKLLNEPKRFSGSWNFGPSIDSNQSVGKLVELIYRNWVDGVPKDWEIEAPKDSVYHESTLLHLNCDKSHQLLKWKPVWGFDQAIAKTVEWFKAGDDGTNTAAITQSQILEYSDALQSQSTHEAVK